MIFKLKEANFKSAIVIDVIEIYFTVKCMFV